MIQQMRLPLICLAAALITLSLTLRPALAEVVVEEVVSPGGITAWLVRDKSVPVTAIEFSFENGGSGHDPEGKSGTATLTASTIDEGAGDLDSKAFQQALADKSIQLSFSARQDAFSGSFYALNRYRDEAIDLLRLALTQPRFDAEPVERIRSQILVGLRQETTDPGSVAGDTIRELIFDGHPYARSSGGSLESVPEITVDDMRSFMARALTKDRLKIGVVADIAPEELGTLLDEAFGDLPSEGVPDPTSEFESAPPAGTLVVDMDVPQSTILFAQQGLKLDDPRYFSGMVLNYVLGGGSFSSMLMEEIRVKRGLAYSTYSFQHPMDHAALLRGGAATENARAGETVSLIQQVIADLQENGVPEERVTNAKTYITGSFPLRFTSSSRIAGQLAAMQVHGFPIDYFDTRNERVEAVTKEDVDALAAELLTPDALTIVVVGRPDGLNSTLAAPGEDG